MELTALLRRGGRVAEWIAYHFMDLSVAGSNPGGEIFPTLITLNYSLTILRPTKPIVLSGSIGVREDRFQERV